MLRVTRTVATSIRGMFITILVIALTSTHASGWQASGEGPYTIQQILDPAYPVEVTAAKAAERIAWISYERGMRNVYTAAGPNFEPVKLTAVETDDGNDMTDVTLSDDGSMVVFVRGHTPNRGGWIANPTSNADGADRVITGVRTSGGPTWRIAEGANPILAPNGRWVLFVRNGQIHRALSTPT